MKNTLKLLATMLLAVTLLVPREAAAVKVIIYHSGQHFFETGSLPEPYAKMPKYLNVKAGYVCNIFGLFWAYFRWWNCQPVAYDGIKVVDASDNRKLVAAIAAKYPQSTMRMGLWTQHGRWIIGAVILVIIVGYFLRRKRRD